MICDPCKEAADHRKPVLHDLCKAKDCLCQHRPVKEESRSVPQSDQPGNPSGSSTEAATTYTSGS